MRREEQGSSLPDSSQQDEKPFIRAAELHAAERAHNLLSTPDLKGWKGGHSSATAGFTFRSLPMPARVPESRAVRNCWERIAC